MFDHEDEGGGGVKIFENLTTWYMDDPYPHICIYYVAELQIFPLELTFTKEFLITSLISRKNFSLALKYFIPLSHRTHCSQFIS